ncbi:MAG: bifunctional aspartate kinase/homoserine dehydrogenase I [Spirochaetae bacterium HGW-Spirochaetae-3]|jgi:aspartokinase/homoserine dehydrogenase 1|nr:MAG: bifunctional aspartate kinase/homoserine dehydrogenase I [Spirochaetae bacterium HGW-Spirochaetae-3]
MTLLFISASALRGSDAIRAVSERIVAAAAADRLVVALAEDAGMDAIGPLGLGSAPVVDLVASPAAFPPLSTARCGLDLVAATASRLGAALELLTGSGCAYQCDPAIVPSAREIESLSFEEAAELSRFRDTGVDPDIIGPILRHRARARIRSIAGGTEGGLSAGTVIDAQSDSAYGPVKAIATQPDVSMLSVSGACLPGGVGVAARVFASTGRAGVSVLLISQSSSEYSICFCVDVADESAALAAVEAEFATELKVGQLEPITTLDKLAILTLTGDGMRKSKGIAGKCFTQLARADVNIVAIAQGSSERSISAVIARSGVERGVRMIFQAFFDSTMPIDLVVVGCGNVGSALLRQLATQTERLAGQGVSVRVVAVANSRRMLVDGNGVDPSLWREDLEEKSAPLDLSALRELGTELANPVLVDCTAGDVIPGAYPEFMLAGFHVVTPNKRGNTGPMDRYLALKSLARRHRRRYLYETTVGAGLPVIENLQNLLHAGDSLDSFNGILSGSLSFLFGRIEDGATFSAAVLEAMDRGFTEPDPRDDLSGADVARKVLILAREAGMPMEFDDIELEGLVPTDYMALDRAEFVRRMPELDAGFEEARDKAAATGKVLRFVGSIAGGEGRAGLAAIGPEHPLFAVRDGENALAFHTRYYNPVPLLLRGYGAGATVTAAGIFADILRTLNWIKEA